MGILYGDPVRGIPHGGSLLIFYGDPLWEPFGAIFYGDPPWVRALGSSMGILYGDPRWDPQWKSATGRRLLESSTGILYGDPL